MVSKVEWIAIYKVVAELKLCSNVAGFECPEIAVKSNAGPENKSIGYVLLIWARNLGFRFYKIGLTKQIGKYVGDAIDSEIDIARIP